MPPQSARRQGGSDHPARLRFVTGKGGVGKTTVAAALALRAAAIDGRVLAVDTLNSGDLARTIETSVPPGGPQPEVLGLTTQDSLNEYVRRYLKVPISPASIGPLSRIFDFVSNAAPGVKEILTVGKVGYEARYQDWDEIVVDAPASGHVVELLAAPTSLHELISSGPLVGQTAWLQELLAGPTTTVTVVATPEELPVAETATLLRRLAEETDVAVDALIVNRAPPPVDQAGIDEARRLTSRSDSTGGSRSALGLVAAAAVDRAVNTAPFEAELYELAADRGVPAVTVVENFNDPVASVLTALAGRL
mgnify:CR=1 FL=1